MEDSSTWIKLHRKILDWEWYDDINVKVLFLHLLLTVNYKDKRWRGVEIKRGSIITSIAHLSLATGLSSQQVRTAIKKLKINNEITSLSQANYTVITVLKYDEYQGSNKPITNEQQTNNKPITNQQQTNNKRLTTTKERKKVIKKESNKVRKIDIDTTNIISKDITVTADTSSEPKSYGNQQINDCIAYLKEQIGATPDGTIQENRRYCHNLLNRVKKDYPELEPVEAVRTLINIARSDDFHRRNATSFRYLFYNIQKIFASFKVENGIGEENSDYIVLC